MNQTSDPNKKPPLNEQLAEVLLKVFMTTGAATSGFGALWSLLKESDLPKAVVATTMSVGFAYVSRLISPLHRGNERRIEQAGEALDAGIEKITASMIATATRFEDKYLLCQALECQSFRAEGMVQRPGIFVPLLKEVFVPLSLDLNASDPGYRHLTIDFDESAVQQSDNQLFQNQSIWDFLKRAEQVSVFRQLAVLAWGGYGKTTLLKHIAYLYGTKQVPPDAPKLVPFLLVLRAHKDLLTKDKPPSLSILLQQNHVPNLAGAAAENLKANAGWTQALLTKGRALVMFDGFDEVAEADRPKIARWLNRQMRQYSKSIFIVTSRPKAYQEQSPVDALNLTSSVWVKDFNSAQRQKFVVRWYQCQERYSHGGRDTPDVENIAAQAAQELLAQIETEPDLRALAKNPLLLNMITTFHRRYAGRELPQRRVELYQEIVQLQLKDRPATRKITMTLGDCEAEIVLQEIALTMMQKSVERIDEQELLQLAQKILSVQGETVSAKDFIDDVVKISELIVQQEDEYEFAHLSFQEYLTAAYIAADPAEREAPLLHNRLKDGWWKATILLYAGRTRKPSILIREAIRQGENDLAYACLQQTTKRVDDELKADMETLSKQLQYNRYSDLERSLERKEWRKADEETYRLMITEVGKEKGQWFDAEDLLNFPCESLKAIDGLWVKYSNGKFGFSVQKDMYMKCGGSTYMKCGGSTLGRAEVKAWNNLCLITGWKYKFYYSSGYTTLKYLVGTLDETVEKGHLPAPLHAGFRRAEWGFSPRDQAEEYSKVFAALCSRAQTCRMGSEE